MYYYRHPHIIYRDYPDCGYLTDNRNFGYDTASKSRVKIGDRLLSKTGSVFYSVLTEKSRSLTEIVNRLCDIFSGVSPAEIERDAEEFFSQLSKEGFVGCEHNINEGHAGDYFSYDARRPHEWTETENSVDGNTSFRDWNEEYRLSRIHLNVSGLCNEHCVHCYFPASFRKKTMSRDLFLAILEQCKDCYVLNITLSGGEPMLNPELPFFIGKCRENNFSINVLSNLTLLTDDLVAEFEKTPLLSVQTSLYSMNDTIHDSITKVKGSFEKTKRAIEILREHNIPMQINCPIIKQNKDTYQEVLNWAEVLNIEANSDYMLFGCIDGSCRNLVCRLDASEVESIVEEESRLHSGKLMLSSSSARSIPGVSVCPVCLNSLCVSYDGNVYPCEGWQSLVLGNIKDVSLSLLWEESPDIQKLRNLTIENDFPKCRLCDNMDYCSICLIRNANESLSGDYREVNPYFCEVARIKRSVANKQMSEELTTVTIK